MLNLVECFSDASDLCMQFVLPCTFSNAFVYIYIHIYRHINKFTGME